MSETLRLIVVDDTPKLQAIFQDALTPLGYTCKVEIVPDYDTDHWNVSVSTNVPFEDALHVFRDILQPLVPSIEEKFGEANWDWQALCKCGNPADVLIWGDDIELQESACQCGECRTTKFMDEDVSECRICGRKFNQWKEDNWRVHLEVHVAKNDNETPTDSYRDHESMEAHAIRKEKETRAKSLIYELGFNIHSTPMDKWDLCSLECAKSAYREWLHRVLNHPFTQECLKSG